MIRGLYNKKEFITQDEEVQLLKYINSQPWNTSLSRRTQHYGYLYNYSNSNVLKSTIAIPPQLLVYKQRLEAYLKPLCVVNFDQCIINEYTPGQGIAPHIDHTGHFGPIVVSLSLGSACTFEMYGGPTSDNNAAYDMILEPRELCILSGVARYKYQHAIPKTKKDRTGTRISITFRTINK
jgi:alkylated DNA repair dioxygenase AlkB